MSWITTAWTVVKTVAVSHAPLIFIGAAAVGVVSTAVIAWRAGKKAPSVLGQAKYEKGSELTRFEKVKATWKLWLPVLAAIILTFGSMGASYYIHSVRLAEMTATCNALLASNKELKRQLDDVAEQAPEIVDQVRKNHMEELGRRSLLFSEDHPDKIFRTGYGNDLIVDAYTGESFYSSYKEVLCGITMFQKAYKDSTDGVYLDDLYKYLHVLRKGMIYPTTGWPKAGKTDIDKFFVPDISLEYQECRVTDPETGEESCEERGCYILSYLPDGVSTDHVFAKGNPWMSQREFVKRVDEDIPDQTIDQDILDAFAL